MLLRLYVLGLWVPIWFFVADLMAVKHWVCYLPSQILFNLFQRRFYLVWIVHRRDGAVKSTYAHGLEIVLITKYWQVSRREYKKCYFFLGKILI